MIDEARTLNRHLDAEGRLIAMPRKRTNRLVILRHIADAIEPDVDHAEAHVNERLRAFDDDVAMLRRYLVDEGLLERRPPGIYRRPALSEPPVE